MGNSTKHFEVQNLGFTREETSFPGDPFGAKNHPVTQVYANDRSNKITQRFPLETPSPFADPCSCSWLLVEAWTLTESDVSFLTRTTFLMLNHHRIQGIKPVSTSPACQGLRSTNSSPRISWCPWSESGVQKPRCSSQQLDK